MPSWAGSPSDPSAAPPETDRAADVPAGDSSPAAETAGPGVLDLEAVRRSWPDVVSRIARKRRATWAFVDQHAQVRAYDGRRLTISMTTVGLANAFRQGHHGDVVREALRDELGIDALIDVITSDSPPSGLDGPAWAGGSGQGQGASVPSGGPSAGTGPGDRSNGPSDGNTPARPPEAEHRARSDWSRAPADPASAPAWASADPSAVPAWAAGTGGDGRRAGNPPEQPEGAPAPDEKPAESTTQATSGPDPRRGPDSPLSPLERARLAAASLPDEVEHEVDDSAVSENDEEIVEAGEAGPAVIERLLGGTVIRDETS